MNPFEASLRNIMVAPYIVKATALIGVKRKSGSNMFRHQMSTFGILLDYKVTDPVLLKASIIHDLFEDGNYMPGVTEEDINLLDVDGPAVYDLVMEVSIRRLNNVKEPKKEFLLRIMQSGSRQAKLLKLADRISNLIDLGFVNDPVFIKKYLQETKDFILPFASAVNEDMFIELTDLVKSREWMLHHFVPDPIEGEKTLLEKNKQEGSRPWMQRLREMFMLSHIFLCMISFPLILLC